MVTGVEDEFKDEFGNDVHGPHTRLRGAWIGIASLCPIIVFAIYLGEASAACIDCRTGFEPTTAGEMAQQVRRIRKHHGDPGECGVCHDGDPTAKDNENARHGTPGLLIEDAGPGGSDSDDPGGIVESVDRVCGQCHQGYVERWRKSAMSTDAAAIGRNLCNPAWRKRRARGGEPKAFGRYRIADEDGPEPAVGSPAYKMFMKSLMVASPQFFPASLHRIPPTLPPQSGVNLATSCRGCHGAFNQSQSHRGCFACHSAHETGSEPDPTLKNAKLETPRMHEMPENGNTEPTRSRRPTRTQSAIGPEICFQCHFDPRLSSVNQTGDARVHYGELGELHDKGGRGLFCQDCHTSLEMHGDGNIPAVDSAQSEVRCEDCHGTTDRFPWQLPLGFESTGYNEITPSRPRGTVDDATAIPEPKYPAEGGYLLTSRGNPFGNVVREGERVRLHSVSGETFEVTLLKSVVEQGSWGSELSRQVKSAPEHHGGMGCMDCHADWLPTCMGCHAEKSFTSPTN